MSSPTLSTHRGQYLRRSRCQSFLNPAIWISEGSLGRFRAAGGTVYGIVGQSMKKAKYGIIGGLIGAGIGGMIFDPIHYGVHRASLSRAVGLRLVWWRATGAAMGWVESALKDRWLLTSRPARSPANSSFFTKSLHHNGSEQKPTFISSKIQHSSANMPAIAISGSRVQMKALGTSYVMGSPITTRVLQDGDLVQIGRYPSLQERHRS